MRKIYTIILFIFFTQTSYSQIDTAFWFAAPDISSAFGYDQPIGLTITSFQQPCSVTISIPANSSIIPQTISLAPNTTQSLDLSSWLGFLECGPGNTVLNKGLKIISNNKISAYYEVSVGGPNPELFALKGKNAEGTSFFISAQYILDNANEYSPAAYSSFNIVATQDNTVVTIIPTNNIVGHAAGIAFSVTLNRGQTYAAIATSQAASAHLQGSSVNATKPIAITLADDLLNGGVFGSTCRDLAGDQTVPVNIIGLEYIAIRSNLNFPYDKVYITAVQNGTTVTQDGIVFSTLNAGQSSELTINGPVTYIQLSKPAYAYQLSGFGCEVGSAILPKINCTGSPSVSVARTTSEAFSVCLLVKNGGQGSFLINGSAGVITAADFAVVPGTGGQWYFAKIPLDIFAYPDGSVITISNSVTLFQEGVLLGSVLGNGFGYFSNYNTLLANAYAADTSLCIGENLQLSSDFIPSTTYTWTGPSGFSSGLQNPVINNVSAINSGDYILTVNVPDCGIYKDTVSVHINLPTTSIVNQSICQGLSYQGYNNTGSYVDIFTNHLGCDSTRTLNLTVKPKSFKTVNQSICQGQSFEGHTTSGTFISTLVAANGCDSIVTLNLTVKPVSLKTINQVICDGQSFNGHTTSGTYISTLVAANGCDSIVTLNLTVKPKSLSTITQSICDGQSYGGHNTTGTFVDVLVAANGCDSIRTLHLTVKPKSVSTIIQSICDGQSYGGHNTTGTFIDVLVAANGCDSTRTLHLTVKPKSFKTVNQSICQGQSFEGHTTSGTFISTLVAANGCDSIVTLNLTVKPVSLKTINQVICDGQSFNGHTTSGTYISTLVAANGCDSIVTLNLTVKPKSLSTITQSICDGQSYGGHNTTGTFVDVLVAANGCDSIRTLNLTVKPKSVSTIIQSICDGQSYGGHTTTGTFIDVLVAANGCDSTRTLQLTVKPKSFKTVNQSICQGQSFEGHTTSGTFISTLVAANGCDSIVTLNLTVKPVSLKTINKVICDGQSFEGHTTSGTYISTLVAANGCDSIVTLNLTVKPKSLSTITQSICDGQSYGGHNTTGTFVDVLVAANGCDSIRTLHLTVKLKSVSTITQSICDGQSYGGHNTTGTFIDVLVAANGCDSTRTLQLTVKPKSFKTINQTICQGSSYLGYTVSGTYTDVLVAANGCDSVRILNLVVLSSLPTNISKFICQGQSYNGYFSSGTYTDTLVSVNGCDSVRILQLFVESPLRPSLGADRSLCLGDTAIINPGVFNNYLWQNGSTQNNYIVSGQGTYYVTVTNSCGAVSDSIKFKAEICDIVFPNAFTPNDDGNNDVFKALNVFAFENYHLVVYNRWGSKIFETNDFSKGWDGKLKGSKSDGGTYVWFCDFKKSGVSGKLKGSVILIR